MTWISPACSPWRENKKGASLMRQVDPRATKRAAAFELWMQAPMPMVTFFKTLNVTNLVRLSRRGQFKFNALLCWCIGRAASQTEEFFLLPVDGSLMQFDKLAVNVVVATRDGGINTCDIPFSGSLSQFYADYLRLTAQVHETCQGYDLGGEYMVIGTSALPRHDLDGAVNIYAGVYNNPFLVWGAYRKSLWRAVLPISFQFHHTQLDGEEAAQFLDRLQAEITSLRLSN